MQPLLLLAFCTFLFSLVYTPLCRDLFRKWGVFDHPDADRKIHSQPIPRVGGVVMVLALGSTYVVSLLLRGRIQPMAGMDLAWRVLPGAGIVFLTGLLDDWISLKPWQKFAGQLLGAGWAYLAGLQVSGAAGFTAQHWLSLPLTLFWLVLCTNAFNLIDGVDGLATGVGLFATLTMVLAAFLQHSLPLAAVTLPLAGFLLGFLRYNFNPANVFLGDSGSLLIGFLLGCFGVIWSDKSATLLGMTAPRMAMFVPLLDVGLSVVRRFLRHQPIFDADRGHIHHRLLDRGLTPRGAVLLLYGACTLGALFSIAQTFAAQQYAGLIVLVFCATTWIGIQHLGYVEFSVASRMLLTGSFQRMLDAQLQMRHFEQALSEATTVDECWTQLTEGCRKFGFDGVNIYFRGRVLEDELAGSEEVPRWTVSIPLPEGGQAELMRRFDASEDGLMVAPMVRILREHLPRKLTALVPEVAQRRAVVSQGGD